MRTRHDAIEAKRQALSVPGVSGDYGDFVELGAVGVGMAEQSFMGVTVLIEGGASAVPSGATVELWLPRIEDGSGRHSGFGESDYFFAGQVVAPAGSSAVAATGTVLSYGAATWEFAGWPGAKLRVRSGGVAGTVTISAVAF